MRAIHFSCLGTPMPTQSTSGCAALICSTSASSSSAVSGAEGRRVAADDLDAGVAPAQDQRELHERALVAAAVEPDAVAALGAAVVVAQHQLGAVDAVVAARSPSRLAAHTSGMPSGTHQRGAAERRAHLGVVVRHHHRVDRRGADVAALAAVDHGRPSRPSRRA